MNEKYSGIFPAFYACYNKNDEIDPAVVRDLTEYLIGKGINGLYVGGSSGECIYQSVAERKLVLENVVKAAAGRVTIIAHVACNNTRDSRELASHAQDLGVDAIAAIPPIYFHLPDRAIAKYWNDISSAAPQTDFFIYNIPQLAGVSLNPTLLRTMMQNPCVRGVKNSSMPAEDILRWKMEGAIVFNGPDEQLISGLAVGADGGIGGTYAVMPELFIKIFDLFKAGHLEKARILQGQVSSIIYDMCTAQGNLYAVLKEIIRIMGGPDCGGVREPLYALQTSDKEIAIRNAEKIQTLISQYGS